MTNGTESTTGVAVIGAGPGGYAAAFHAADLGLDVTLIDAAPRPGGVCLNCGCIPSKALLHIAKLMHEARAAEAWGIRFAEPEVDLARLREWKEGIIGRLAGGITQLAGGRNVRLLRARATFVDSETLRLTGEGDLPETLRFEHAIVATGSQPAIPPSLAVDDPRVMDSTGALELAEIPERLLVVGGGYIGLEMGTIYAALGPRVTVVELTDGLLPGADRDLVRPLARRLGQTFEAIHLSTKVLGFRPEEGGIACSLEGAGGSSEEMFQRVLVAVGRRPLSCDLGLENTGVVVNERGFITVDAQMRTADPRILAIGDVAGEPMLAHKAAREARVAAEAAAGKPAAYDAVAVPAVVFTDPEIAWCGLTETEAQEQGRTVAVSRFPWAASGRAVTLDRTEGQTKLIFDPESERLLGVGIVGPGAGDLISEGVLGLEMAAVARDIADSIHPHPTLSETIAESAEGFLGHATHLFRRR